MNKVAKFFHELFTPHCEHCSNERRLEREEQKEQAILRAQLEEQQNKCVSCETLASENARLVRENERLLEALLEKPTTVNTEKVQDVRDLKPIQTTRAPFIPSHVRRQMLENESRHSATLAREAPKPDAVLNKDSELKDLETELDNVRKEREATTTKAS